MSIWMGGGLLAPADVRHSLNIGAGPTEELLVRLGRTASLMNRAAMATVLSGGLLVWFRGGVQSVSPGVAAGAALAMLAIAAGRWMIRPVIRDILQAREHQLTRAEARSVARRFTFAVQSENLLRFAALVLMMRPGLL